MEFSLCTVVSEMIMGENYERNITLIRSDISRFSRGTVEQQTTVSRFSLSPSM